MPRTLPKILPHLIIWLVLGAYMFMAPRIYDHLYVKQGRPVNKSSDWSMRVIKGYSTVDDVISENPAIGLFRIKGWAFAPVRPQLPLQDYERKLILFSRSQVYVLPAETVERPDVQSYFVTIHPGMDVTGAGFSSLISSGVLKPGCYEIRILLRNAASDFSYSIKTGRTLRRTPNTLVLEGPNATDCLDK